VKISVVISTRNASKTLSACLESLKEQSRMPDEIIMVDRDSSDKTVAIARKYTDKIYNYGPERSAQRNFGAKKAVGDYLLFVDADMELTPNVISEGERLVIEDKSIKAVAIPEESFGEGFWASVKAFERSFYLGEEKIEAPRLIDSKSFEVVGGYDENLVAGEDWDLRNRLEAKGIRIGRIKRLIRHNEGRLSLLGSAFKKYYYGRHIKRYLAKGQYSFTQVFPLRAAFFRNPSKLIRNPDKTIGLLILKGVEYAAAAFGLVGSLISRQEKKF
jgi:glycosyltransferase involved in cell wall biosynthesis